MTCARMLAAAAARVHIGRVSPYAPRLYMDRLLGPGRALSRRGTIWLLSALGVWNLLVAAFLVAIHAWPVPPFLGLDFFGVLIALRVSHARAAARERVQVSAEQISISREGPRPEVLWTSPTAFTRVAVERAARGAQVRLAMSDRSRVIATGLGPVERLAFGRELERAVALARAERWR